MKGLIGLLLVLSLFGASSLLFPMRFSRADTIIYIMADGSILPVTAPVTSADNMTYVCTDTIIASIDIQRDNIFFLPDNHTIQGSINISNRINVTVEGPCTVSGSIDATGCTNVTVEGITVSGDLESWGSGNRIIGNTFTCSLFQVPARAIWVQDSNNDIISGNKAEPGDIDQDYQPVACFRITNCNSCTVQANNVSWAHDAIYCEGGSNNIIYGNTVTNCRHGIVGWSDNCIIESNNLVHFFTDREASVHQVYDTVGLSFSGTNETIRHNLVANSSNAAISISVNNSEIIDNKAINSAVGFQLAGYGNEVINNSVTDNVASIARTIGDFGTAAYGLILGGSDMVLRNNTMERNSGSFALNLAGDLSNYINDVDTSNKIDGKPIYYCNDKHNLTIPTDAGYAALINCSDMTIQGLNLTNNGQGMFLAFTANSTITNNNVTANRQGIFLHNCSQAKITDNSITSNGDFGIKLESCTDSTVHGNAIVGNTNGIVLSMSNNTRITCNTDQSNGAGLYFDQSSFCVVYHNNFIQNSNQVVIASSSNNTFDNRYPSGGNFWSDYTGVDAKATGLGFPYYIVSGEAQDMYPLMGQITAYDVTLQQNKTEQIDVESNSTVSAFQFNESARAISFNVEGPENTTGFCRITVPQYFLQDLWLNNLSIFVSGTRVEFENFTDTQNAYLFFTYKHSEHSIVIVPEYTSTIVLNLFIISLALTITFCRKKAARITTKNQYS